VYELHNNNYLMDVP